MISARYQIPTASPGAMLREEKSAGTDLGIAAEKLTSQGKLLPDEIVSDVVLRWLETHDGQFIFDGFPRSLGQAAALDRMLADRHTPLEVVLSLEADTDTIAHRVENRLVCSRCRTNVSLGLHVARADEACPKCGGRLVRRNDDNLETLRSRMAEYAEKTEPLIAHYTGLGLLRSVDSTRTPEVVFAAIADILEEP